MPVVADSVLSVLCSSTIYNDSVALFALVNQYRTTEYVRNNSGWVLLDSADQMFTLVKQRVYNKNGEFEPEECPKWKTLSEVLRVEIPGDIKETIIKARKSRKSPPKEPVSVLILCSDARTCYQLNQYLTQGAERNLFYSAIKNNVPIGKLSEKYRKLEQVKERVEIQRLATASSGLSTAAGKSSSSVEDHFGSNFLKQQFVKKRLSEAKKDKRKSGATEEPIEVERSEIEEFLSKTEEPLDEEAIYYKDSYVLTISQKGGIDVALDDTFDLTQAHDLMFESFSQPDDMDLTSVVAAATRPLVFIQTFRTVQYGPMILDKTLQELKPAYIIMYHMNITAIRHIECYEARQQREAESRLKVFFLVHDKTVEEQAYLTLLRREKQAFELLINTKQHMVIPKYQDGRCDDVLAMIQQEILDEAAAESSTSSRKAGGQQVANQQKKQQPKIVVDMREFRSDLPCLIHKRGIEVVPVTIAVSTINLPVITVFGSIFSSQVPSSWIKSLKKTIIFRVKVVKQKSDLSQTLTLK